MSKWRDVGAPVTTTAIILATTLASALPWSIAVKAGDGATSAAVLIPAAAICACVLARPRQTPSLAVFVAGLLMDAVTAGPLGYWSLVYLAMASVARAGAARMASGSVIIAWLIFAVAAAGGATLAWAVSSLFRLQVAPIGDIAGPAIVALVAFPIVAGAAHALLAVIAPAPVPVIRAGSE